MDTGDSRMPSDEKTRPFSSPEKNSRMKRKSPGYGLLLFRDDFVCFPASARFLTDISREYAYIPINF